jgi:hypothetical protein
MLKHRHNNILLRIDHCSLHLTSPLHCHTDQDDNPPANRFPHSNTQHHTAVRHSESLVYLQRCTIPPEHLMTHWNLQDSTVHCSHTQCLWLKQTPLDSNTQQHMGPNMMRLATMRSHHIDLLMQNPHTHTHTHTHTPFNQHHTTTKSMQHPPAGHSVCPDAAISAKWPASVALHAPISTD